jgi:calcineurin-like phosphoesterase family protein
MGINFTNSWGQVTDNTTQMAEMSNQTDALITRSKNLINNDPDFWTQGGWWNPADKYAILSSAVYLSADKQYYFSYSNSNIPFSPSLNVIVYDTSDTKVGSIVVGVGTAFIISSITYPAYAYIKISISTGNSVLLLSPDWFFALSPNIQIEEGSTSTDYKPYFNGTIRKEYLTSAVQDKINEISKVNGDFKLVFVSDVHLGYGTLVGEIKELTDAQRMTHLVNSLNYENAIAPIDMVFFIGDMTTNNLPTHDYLVDFIAAIAELDMSYMCLHGNHEGYTPEAWSSLFGYNINYILSLKNLDIICLDIFSNLLSPMDMVDVTGDRLTAIQEYLEYSKNDKAILVGHYLYTETLTNLQTLFAHEKIICGFHGHIHTEETSTMGDKSIYQDGQFSYVQGTDKPWTYRIFESVNGVLATRLVNPGIAYPSGNKIYTVISSATPVAATTKITNLS